MMTERERNLYLHENNLQAIMLTLLLYCELGDLDANYIDESI